MDAKTGEMSGCPFHGSTEMRSLLGRTNRDWWPQAMQLDILTESGKSANPYGEDFDYAEAFNTLDYAALKADLTALMTDSQPWWPADYGHYGPFFIRMAWHAAGTYRTGDGRGGSNSGQQRFAPLNSWPDNGNLDKARRLLWPIKQKYGKNISWADLFILTGNVAIESMGGPVFGFGGGRADVFEPESVYWGTEEQWVNEGVATRIQPEEGMALENPLAAIQMGLIYVNPEGPNGNPDPLAAAKDIRETFGRMAMNDEETVALIAGGHTFGKAHGAHKAEECIGADPAGSPTEQQGIGWVNKCGTGKGVDAVTSGLEGAWSVNPIAWTTQYLDNLFGFDWVQTRSPGGAIQWIPSDKSAANLVPDAHDKTKRHAPIMFTTDLALKMDPEYRKVSERFHKDPDAFADAFARAWFKLTHRDMGPRWRYLGADAPKVDLIWQDPVPAVDHPLVDAQDVASLKAQILGSGLTTQELVRTAWAAAASYRDTDMRGGTNGGRLRLAPQKDWAVNNPAEITKVVAKLEAIQTSFNKAQKGGKKISLADTIVLAGNAGIEEAARKAGHSLTVPFKPGRGDASQAQTDVAAFEPLEPTADGFRNYYGAGSVMSPVDMLVDRANMLSLTVPEMTVLVGGLRALDANTGGAKHGVFTSTPGQLNNAFFVNLLDMGNKWTKSPSEAGLYEGRDIKSGQLKWTATPVDLIFGSNSELRAVAEVYAASDGEKKFAEDFVAAWTKVMNLGLQ